MYFDETLDKRGYSNKPRDIMGNFNIDLQKSESCDNFLNYLLFPEEQLYKTCKEITFINNKKKNKLLHSGDSVKYKLYKNKSLSRLSKELYYQAYFITN